MVELNSCIGDKNDMKLCFNLKTVLVEWKNYKKIKLFKMIHDFKLKIRISLFICIFFDMVLLKNYSNRVSLESTFD